MSTDLLEISHWATDVKRLKVPVFVSSTCPQCGHGNIVDLSMNGLNYPVTEKPEPVYNYCDSCEHEYYIDVTLKVQLEIDYESIKPT